MFSKDFIVNFPFVPGSFVNGQATEIDGGREWLDDRAAEWERFLRWSHASYGWTEEVVVRRAGERNPGAPLDGARGGGRRARACEAR